MKNYLHSWASRIAITFCVLGMTTLVGCADYKLPGASADFHSMGISLNPVGDESRVAKAKITPTFPATISLARVQGPVYMDNSVQTYGEGTYCVVMTRNVEDPDALQKLSSLRLVSNLEPVNKLHLQQSLSTVQQLREAAVGMGANMLLIYSFDDSFRDQDGSPGLTILTIGILQTKNLTLTSTASAVLMDPRTGFVYGATEATERKTATSNGWGEAAAADSTRLLAETASFTKLTGEVEKMWNGVLTKYAPPVTNPLDAKPAM